MKITVRCGIANFLKADILFLACMVEEYTSFGNYEDVPVENSNELNAHLIYVLRDDYYILSVRETLHDK